MEKQTEIFVSLQKKWIELNNIKNGDEVKVIRNFEEGEGGCISGYYSNNYVGQVFKIDDELNSAMHYGINLKGGPILPYFCLEPVKKKEVFYKRGDKFKISGERIGDGTYIIASASRNSSDPWFTMICIDGAFVGNCLRYAIKIKNPEKITEKEMIKMCGDYYDKLVKV